MSCTEYMYPVHDVFRGLGLSIHYRQTGRATRNLNPAARSPRSIRGLRDCWAAQVLVGWAVINVERTDEALGTGAEVIATSCPYCLIMLGDAVAQRNGEGQADGVVVIDLAQVLADSVGLRKLV